MADSTRKKRANRQPITSHPLFPLVVMLWFGALFGLISIAIRPALIGHLVQTARIDALIPMAAPPLGTTARILLALLMTAGGCLMGWLVARRIATPRSVSTVRRRRAAPEADAGSPLAFFGTRESTSAEQDATDAVPSDNVLQRQLAPAPAVQEDQEEAEETPRPAGPQVLNVAELGPDLDFDEQDDAWASPFRRTEAKNRESFQPVEAAIERDPFDNTSAPRHHAPLQFTSRPDDAELAAQTDGKRNRLFDAYVHATRPSPATAVEEAQGSTPAPGFASLVDRELKLDRVDADDEGSHAPATEHETAAPHAHTDTLSPAAAPSAPTILSQGDRSTAAERIASAPLEELSHVELLERLALALERRRAMSAARARSARMEAPAPFNGAEEEDEHETEERGDGYSSLLDISMRMYPRPPADAHADPHEGLEMPEPVVMFPAHQVTCPQPSAESASEPAGAASRAFDGPQSAQREPEETERTLQLALAKLQRMSGAA